MAEAVYILCAVTCAACAVLLFRGYSHSRARLLLWSALCFTGLTANNIVVFLDLVIFPSADLLVLRQVINLASMCLLLYGLIWESQP
jgi:uncharacterized protein DUF5985